jgi:hypothetical protein
MTETPAAFGRRLPVALPLGTGGSAELGIADAEARMQAALNCPRGRDCIGAARAAGQMPP